ncbi:hypothetical protein [Pedobacter nutrimenti]|uniref:Uncharacterized protein n=1 Tax=Pedobacter nutrimenti TaxID=1241337 RepID=A0A318UCA1_9SPHI|nr:hypothetical protein [Pedobacter nutrimenti]PYF74062.1 hypothetical protein B0O44_104233 [Pedobacter nutrimenti]
MDFFEKALVKSLEGTHRFNKIFSIELDVINSFVYSGDKYLWIRQLVESRDWTTLKMIDEKFHYGLSDVLVLYDAKINTEKYLLLVLDPFALELDPCVLNVYV